MTSKPSYAVSVGHDLAAKIAVDVMENGGNAIDAGVAASIAISVLHSEQVQFSGVAPILIRTPDDGQIWCVEGAGRWPAATDRQLFIDKHRGGLPMGILRTVAPAALDAWLTSLIRFGTMGFAELATPAMKLARSGFPAHEDMAACSSLFERYYNKYEENARIWLPGGKPVEIGQHFIQSDLADMLSALIDADKAAASRKGRIAGLQAVRDLFYKGDIADIMIHHVQELGGWLSHSDLADHVTPVVAATSARAFGSTLYTPGPWSQAPVLPQILQILEHSGLETSSNNTASNLHTLIEAIKIGMADRDGFYGDPDFVDTPLDILLSEEYAKTRAALIQEKTAFEKMPPAGEISQNAGSAVQIPPTTKVGISLDTSVVAIIDGNGAIFTSTPSDSSLDAPVVPGLGFVISTRGSQSFTDKDHPASIYPGKRPRVSACPTIIKTQSGKYIAAGGPGADLQVQAMAQILTNHLCHNMSLDDALSAPRIFSQTPPHSTDPHFAFPGKITVEEAISESIFEELKNLGHKAMRGTADGFRGASVCLATKDPDGTFEAFGDFRRASGQYVRQ